MAVLGLLKDDNKAIFKAAGAAQKAADYILDRDAKGVPAYLKDVVKAEKGKIIPKKESKNKSVATEKGKLSSKYTYERFTADLPPLKTIELSYRGISFSEEKRAKSEVKEWGDELVSIYNDKLKKAEKKDRVAEFHETFDLLYPRFLKRKLTIISRRSGLLSTMITGGSNFPVRSQKKKQDSYHNALTDYIDYANYFSDKLNKAIFKSEAIKSGESDTLEKLREKLAELQKNHEIMKNANVADRKSVV